MKMKLDNCNSLLVNKECVSVGKMLDHAVHSLHLNADSFFALFITSGLAKVFEQNDIRYIAGMSGIELSYEVLERCGVAYSRITPRHTAGLSKEYYAGYALALMQAETGLSYKVLTDAMPVSEMISIYENYHSNAVNELPWQMAGEERADSIDKIKADFPSFLFDEMKAVLAKQYSDMASDSSEKKAEKQTEKDGSSGEKAKKEENESKKDSDNSKKPDSRKPDKEKSSEKGKEKKEVRVSIMPGC